MSQTYKEHRELFLIESEKLDKEIAIVQKETLEVAKIIVANPSSYSKYAIDAAKDIIKNS
jgi:hypothetical protein